MYNSVWFNSLTKPFLNPPSKVFPPVWSVLYILIFISLFFYIVAKTGNLKMRGYLYFGVQILLNLLWSPVFFLAHNIALALFIVILLDIFVVLTIKSFYKMSKISAFLLVPYLLWIFFATYLNFAYLILNR